MTGWRMLLLLALMWLGPLPALASTAPVIMLQGMHSPELPYGALEVAVEPKAEFPADIRNIMATDALRWQVVSHEAPNYGFAQQPHWFRFRVQNTAQHASELLLEIAYPLLDEVRLYQVDVALNEHRQVITGVMVPIDERPYYHHNLIIPLSIPALAAQDIYLRVATKGSLQVPLRLWQPDEFHRYDQSRMMAFGALFGMLLVMAIYNFFLFAMIRDLSLLYYVAYSVVLMLFQAQMHGFANQWLWPTFDWWRANAIVVLIPLLTAFGCLFAQSFLQLKSRYSRLNRLLMVLAGLSAVLLVLGLILPYSFVIRLQTPFSILVAMVLLGVGMERWNSGFSSARLFVLAWAFFLAAVVLYAISKMGWVPRTWLTEYAMPAGAMIEMVLFAFALAHRYNAQRRAYMQAQQTALRLQRIAKEDLEVKVNERTLALQQTLAELEQANQRLQSISTLDGLTGIKNRRYFDDRLASEWQLALRNRQPLSLLLLDIDHFKQFNDQYGHLAGDECLKQVAVLLAETATRPSDEAARYGGEEFAIILPNTDASGATHVAEGIRRVMETTSFIVDQRAHRITLSIGAACFDNLEGRYPSDLIAAADEALYAAKISGRNRVVSYTADSD